MLRRSALKAYRARVRHYREHGQSYTQAQRSALLSCSSAFRTWPDPRPSLPVDPLSALLAHPEFRHGLADAQATFVNEDEPLPLTEEEMIEEVEAWLSQDGFERDKMVSGQRLAASHLSLQSGLNRRDY